jgi:protein O-GlcNAc transferase
VLTSLGRDEEALESCRKAIAIKPDYVEVHYNAGMALRALGRTMRRSRTSTARWRSIRITTRRTTTAAVLEALNRIDEALACYDRALALVPDFTEARNNRGRILFGLDRGDDAIENFTIAIRINPRDAEAWYQRGRHLLDLSRNDEANADHAQALLLRATALSSRSASNSRGFAV